MDRGRSGPIAKNGGHAKERETYPQIKEKKYYNQYELSNKKIFLNGVRFDTKTGQIADW